MTTTERKHKHLTFDDRLAIQEGLTRGMTFKAIAAGIGKDQTTVSKEVKKRLSIYPSTTKRLNRSGLVDDTPCPKILTAPFVCNGCAKRRVRCAFEKRLYDAKHAQKEYEALLSEAREGVALNREQFYEMDRVVSECVRSGQHIYHIAQTHDLGMSKSSIYRNLHRGFLSISPVDLPRAVKFKTRHKRREQYVPKAMKAGRSYEDFLDFIDRGNVSAWMEMDTLIGRVGGKTIMTFHFTFCNFMPAFLLPDKTAAAVRDQVLRLKRRFSDSEVRFGDIVPLVLTDNGGEFSDIFSLENDLAGRKETDLFFCDPMRSDQKAKIEKNHTLFRDIVPKGSSFDHFSQDTVDLIASHVNSVKRKLFNGKTPYEMFSYTFGDEIPKLFGVRPISAKDVLQSPKLLQSAEAVSTFSAQPPITL